MESRQLVSSIILEFFKRDTKASFSSINKTMPNLSKLGNLSAYTGMVAEFKVERGT